MQIFPSKDLETEEVLVQEEFLAGVNDLINSYQATESGRLVLNYYMIWRILASFYPDRPQEEAQRKERCLKETEEAFAPAVTSMYIKAKGVGESAEVVEQVDSMVDIMQNAFRENLPKLTWMSSSSQVISIEPL